MKSNLLRRCAAAAALFLGACGGRGDAPARVARDSAPGSAATARADGTAPGLKACDLLSKTQIARVTGAAIDAGVTTNDYLGSSQCRFGATGNPKGGVMVALHQHGDLADYRKVPGSARVVGVGDDAVWNQGTLQIAVRQGAAVFSISFFAPNAKRQWAVQLAQMARAKLR